MTFELRILALSVVLGLVQIVLASHAASLQRGYLWTAGSRDEAVPPLTGIAGRLERALRNFVETFPLFAAAVLIAHVTNTHSWMTEWGVQLYFGARVAYLAVYAAGVFLLRSLVWNVATLGIAMVLLSLVLNHASAVEHAARSGFIVVLLLVIIRSHLGTAHQCSRPLSEIGTKPKCPGAPRISGVGGKADIARASRCRRS